jgi:hypothetical protein
VLTDKRGLLGSMFRALYRARASIHTLSTFSISSAVPTF